MRKFILISLMLSFICFADDTHYLDHPKNLSWGYYAGSYKWDEPTCIYTNDNDKCNGMEVTKFYKYKSIKLLGYHNNYYYVVEYSDCIESSALNLGEGDYLDPCKKAGSTIHKLIRTVKYK